MLKWKKWAHSGSPAEKNIVIFSKHKNLPRFFSKGIFCLYVIKCWKVCHCGKQTRIEMVIMGAGLINPVLNPDEGYVIKYKGSFLGRS